MSPQASFMKKMIPNAITLLNLFLGCMAIVFAFNGNLIYLPYILFWAGWADFFDGLAARMLKVHSPLGLQLDSLADMVTFGVVPGVVLFHLLNQALNYPDNIWLLAPAFLITIFSALRLAKFNIDTRQTTGFLGLPTPANTVFITGLIVIAENNTLGLSGLVLNPLFLYAVIVIFSLLLVVELPMYSFKFKHRHWQGNEVRYILTVTGLLTFAITGFAGMPFFILFYILLSVLNVLLWGYPKISEN